MYIKAYLHIYIYCLIIHVHLIGDIVLEGTLKEAQLKAEELKLQLRNASDCYNEKFNIYWGQLFKAGHHDSQFAKQVLLFSLYACSYDTYHQECTCVYHHHHDFVYHKHHHHHHNVLTTINTNMQIRSDFMLVFIRVE